MPAEKKSKKTTTQKTEEVKAEPVKKFTLETEEEPKVETPAEESTIEPVASEPEATAEKEVPTEAPVSETQTPSQESDSTISSFSMLDSNKSESESSKANSSILDPQPETEVKEEPVQEPEVSVQTESTAENETSDKSEQISSDEVKKWLKDVRPDTTKEVDKGGGGKKSVLLLFVFLMVVGVIAGGFFYFKSDIMNLISNGETQVIETIIEEETEVTAPEPTIAAVEEEVDFSQYSVSVLNGSGVAGEAGRMKTTLDTLEFKQVTPGNASSQDYTSTTVSMKEDVPNSVFDAIRELLTDNYAIVKSEDALKDDSSYDIIIIVGLKKE